MTEDRAPSEPASPPPGRALLVNLNHPAHFHLFRHAIAHWKAAGRKVVLATRERGILCRLVEAAGWEHQVLSRAAHSRLGLAGEMLVRDARMARLVRRERIDLLLGTSVAIAHAGWLLGRPAWVFTEDDADVTPLFVRLTYPFCRRFITPRCCRGDFDHRHTVYDSYHELAYLHPNRFTRSPAIPARYDLRPGGYAVVRFSALQAHHDVGVQGISPALRTAIRTALAPLAIVESVEGQPPPIQPEDMHQVLASARVLVSDSQTMTMEAAVLGVPSIRINSFVGRCSVIEELEQEYGLTRGFRPGEDEAVLNCLSQWQGNPDLADQFAARRARMLAKKIDLSTWILDEVERWETDAGKPEMGARR